MPMTGVPQKNAPELPIGRFFKAKSLGGNRVILGLRPRVFDGTNQMPELRHTTQC